MKKRITALLLSILMLFSLMPVTASAEEPERVAPKADIVFVIDTTGSMSSYISSAKQGMNDYTKSLEDAGVDYRIAIMEFRDITVSGEESSTKIKKNASGAVWSTTSTDVKNILGNMGVDGGGDTPETPIDALGMMLKNIGFRSEASKFAVLVTDAGYKSNNNYGYKDMYELIDALADSRVYTSVVSTSSYQSTYSNLVSETDGIFCSLSSAFSSELSSMTSLIINNAHSYTAVVTAPSCTEEGYTTYTCTHCTDKYVGDHVPALGHEFVEGYCTRCKAPDPEGYIASGRSEDDLIWRIKLDGTLVISGTGAMADYGTAYYDYSTKTKAPWREYYADIKAVEISEGVTYVGANMLYNCDNVKSVKLAESVKTMGSYAFYDCDALNSIDFGDGLETIGSYAFYGCGALNSIEFGDGLKTIGSDAFCDCGALRTLTIPGNVKTIGGSAFQSCNISSLTLENGIVSIGSYAFAYNNMTELIIPESVESIGSYAFYACSNLSSISIGSGVKSIGEKAFYSTSYYNKKSNWSGDGALYIGKFLVDTVGEVTDCEVREGTVLIADNAFYNRSKLVNISLPESLRYIGNSAFSSCSGLTKINIPSKVKSIGSEAFYNCYNLTSVTIGDSVESIGSSAFEYCSSLTSVYISDLKAWCEISYSDYSASPLSCNSNTKNLYVNDKLVTELEIPEGTTKIAPYAFYRCGNITSVTIPDSVESIGSYAFYYCSSLTSVTIPDSVKSIGSYAFYECGSLKSVTIGDSVESIGSYAFYECGSLKSVTIGDSVESIGSYAFYCCSSLTSVTIPKSVTSIGSYAFSGCSSLSKVHYGGTKADWDKISIGSSNSYLTSATRIYTCGHNYVTTVIAPTCTTRGYTQKKCSLCGDTVCSDYVDAKGHKFENGICTVCKCEERLGSGSCGSYSNWSLNTNGVLTISGSGSVTSSPWRTSYADKVKTVNVAAGITSLCSSAFYNCTSLEKIAFEGKAVSLGSNVFYGTPADMVIQVTKGDYTWTDSGAYDEEAQTWQGKSIVFVGGHEHAYALVSRVAPGCVTTGLETYECSVCGHTKKLILNSLNHDYKSVVTDPCCTEQGFTTYTCSVCKDSYKTDYIAATGHNFSSHTVAPGCATYGYTYCECTCGLFYTTDIKAPVGHSYTPLETAATCTDQGYTTYTCSACGDKYVADIVKATGHDFESVVTDPTCTTLGYTTHSCKNCDYVLIDTYTATVPHSYTHVDTAATCTEQGYTTYTCSVCGDYFVGDVVKAKGHSYTGIKTDPTCAEQGYTTYTCSVCKDEYVSDLVKAKGHDFESVITDPTCTTLGYTTHSCKNCDYVLIDTYTATIPHTYTPVETQPTCTEQGYTTYTCSVCGDKYVADIVKAKGHSYTNVATDPTCAKMGYTTHTCACGFSYIDNYVDCVAHDFNDWEMTVQPSCVQTGIKTHTCKSCGFLEMYDTGEYGTHFTELQGKKVESCCESGYTGDEVCLICEATVTSGKVLAPHAHTTTLQNAFKASCTQTGYTGDQYCSECKSIVETGSTINMTAHNYKDGKCTACAADDPDYNSGGNDDGGSFFSRILEAIKNILRSIFPFC